MFKAELQFGVPRSDIELITVSDVADLVRAGAIDPFEAKKLLQRLGLSVGEESESLDLREIKETLDKLPSKPVGYPKIVDLGDMILYILYPVDYFKVNSLRKVTLDSSNGVVMVVGSMPDYGIRMIQRFEFKKIRGWTEDKVRDYVKAMFGWW